MPVFALTYSINYYFFFFFFNDTATTEIYTLSLHDALPICRDRERGQRTGTGRPVAQPERWTVADRRREHRSDRRRDRKSTRLNSSYSQISYAVFCLKKKKQS